MKTKHSILDLPIRIIKKGKKRGRPSKIEITASKLMSWYMEQPEVKKTLMKFQEDMMLYGSGFMKLPNQLKTSTKNKERA